MQVDMWVCYGGQSVLSYQSLKDSCLMEVVIFHV